MTDRPASPELRIRPRPTAQEEAAIREALAALGLVEAALPAGSPDRPQQDVVPK